MDGMKNLVQEAVKKPALILKESAKQTDLKWYDRLACNNVKVNPRFYNKEA